MTNAPLGETGKVLTFRPVFHGRLPPTLAELFSEYLVGRGFRHLDAPGLEPLTSCVDHLLIRPFGPSHEIIAIVDGDAHPDAKFSLPVAQVRALLQPFAAQTPTINGVPTGLVLKVYEIGAGRLNRDATARLSAFSPRGGDPLYFVSWIWDSSSGEVWTTRPLEWAGPSLQAINLIRRLRKGDTSSSRWFRRGNPDQPTDFPEYSSSTPFSTDEFAEPAETSELAVEGPDSGQALPFATIGLGIILFAIFVCEYVFRSPRDYSPYFTPNQLLRLGGLTRDTVLNGDWSEVFTASLLHASPLHVLGNLASLAIVGIFLDFVIGWRWLLGGFAISALAGSLFALWFNPESWVTVGASGAIVGLYAMSFVIGLRHLATAGFQAMMISVYGLIPAFLPVIGSSLINHEQVDYMTHLGGLVGGVAIGLCLNVVWGTDDTRPRGSWVALGAAFAYFAIGFCSLWGNIQ